MGPVPSRILGEVCHVDSPVCPGLIVPLPDFSREQPAPTRGHIASPQIFLGSFFLDLEIYL
jgi:hypothetical protein